MRRVPSVDALIPALYLKGISTGDFSEALTAILGEGASGLSATNIVRLKSSWETDYKEWSQRDLSAKRYVYWWADGVYFNVRLDEERGPVAPQRPTCCLRQGRWSLDPSFAMEPSASWLSTLGRRPSMRPQQWGCNRLLCLGERGGR